MSNENKIYRITLIGRVPSKKNNKQIVRFTKKDGTKGSCIVSSSDYKNWHADASMQLKSQKAMPLPDNEYMVHVHFIHGDKKKFDLTNKVESIHDLLVDNGILSDDNWSIVDDARQTHDYIKGHWQTDVSIYPADKYNWEIVES